MENWENTHNDGRTYNKSWELECYLSKMLNSEFEQHKKHQTQGKAKNHLKQNK